MKLRSRVIRENWQQRGYGHLIENAYKTHSLLRNFFMSEIKVFMHELQV